jgi:phosphopantothenoylcysteine synthetase/decarboxylase
MRFLITAGGTREYIDPVRFISNASSGTMGYALATAAVKAGHQVTVISANVSLKPPENTKIIEVVTAKQMYQAVKKQLPLCDCLIMSAAVSDYTVDKSSKTKLKKTNREMTLRLKPTVDILKWAGKNKKKKLVVGFALEDKAIRKEAEKKLIEKNLDMIVANCPKAIGAKTSTIRIKTRDGKWLKLENIDKQKSAKKIISIVDQIINR